MKAQILKLFIVILLTVFVFITACGNNSPSTTTQNSYEFEVVGNNISNIAYYYNNGSIVGVIPTTTDWTYNFQASSGENYWLEGIAGCCGTIGIHLYKNGNIVASAATTSIGSITGNLP